MQRPSEMTMGTILLVLGAFAGFCFGRFTSNLAPKELVMQWDIGNTFVGAATIIVAITSIWIALNNRKRDGFHKIADYRMQWIEALRQELAEFLSLLKDASGKTAAYDFTKDNFNLFNDPIVKSERLRRSISMRLSLNEKNHVEIINRMEQILGQIVFFIQSEEKSNENVGKIIPNIIAELNELETIARSVVKEEWRRVKAEIKEGT